MQQTDLRRKRKIRAGLAFAALTIVIVGSVIVSSPSKNKTAMEATNKVSGTSASKPTPTIASTTPTAAAGTTPTNSYKDGTYSATGEYFSPGGQESIKVTLTLSSDVVTSSSAQSGANDPTAQTYQSSFIGGYKKYVVGKKITSIKISNVAGSSLTSQGFEDALKQIEKQAKA